MNSPQQFNDYSGYDFFFKKFDSLEDFKEAGEKAVQDFLASGKALGRYSYFNSLPLQCQHKT